MPTKRRRNTGKVLTPKNDDQSPTKASRQGPCDENSPPNIPSPILHVINTPPGVMRPTTGSASELLGGGYDSGTLCRRQVSPENTPVHTTIVGYGPMGTPKTVTIRGDRNSQSKTATGHSPCPVTPEAQVVRRSTTPPQLQSARSSLFGRRVNGQSSPTSITPNNHPVESRFAGTQDPANQSMLWWEFTGSPDSGPREIVAASLPYQFETPTR